MAWPYLGPWQSPQGPIREEVELEFGGHPTVPGDLDRDQTYPRLPTFPNSPGNGIAGRPRYTRLAPAHGKVGGMLPGPTPSGPQQPGVNYDDGSE